MMRLVFLPVYVCILLNEKGRENYRQIDNSLPRVLFLLLFIFFFIVAVLPLPLLLLLTLTSVHSK